jgi:hypothetical protein
MIAPPLIFDHSFNRLGTASREYVLHLDCRSYRQHRLKQPTHDRMFGNGIRRYGG